MADESEVLYADLEIQSAQAGGFKPTPSPQRHTTNYVMLQPDGMLNKIGGGPDVHEGDEMPSENATADDGDALVTRRVTVGRSHRPDKPVYMNDWVPNHAAGGSSGVPVEEQTWFWGAARRQEVELHLKKTGDYLIRVKADDAPSPTYILSTRMPDKYGHFIIDKTPAGQYRFEGGGFETPTALINFHVRDGAVITAGSAAVITNAIVAPWNAEGGDSDESDGDAEEIDTGSTADPGVEPPSVRGDSGDGARELVEIWPPSGGPVPAELPAAVAPMPKVTMVGEDWADIEKHRILSFAGTDRNGRPIFTFAACNLPANPRVDYERLAKYMDFAMTKLVESDYSIVYFHHGLSSGNKPSLSWLRRLYSGFGRDFKKNLKNLYVVHPTTFFRVMLRLVRPFISSKFAHKIVTVHRLNELVGDFYLEKLEIPPAVKAHDAGLVIKDGSKGKSSKDAKGLRVDPNATKSMTVFGADLSSIEVQPETQLPQVVVDCMAHIRAHGLKTEGIFRRSVALDTVKLAKQKYNSGTPWDFTGSEDPHLAAVLLKSFFRELTEPVMTHKLYPMVIKVADESSDEHMIAAVAACVSQLPERNRVILEALASFFTEVAAHSEHNKMTFQNIAIVFGPNVAWSEDSVASFSSGIGKVNTFTEKLFGASSVIFKKQRADGRPPRPAPFSI